jgi:hypothetical protein
VIIDNFDIERIAFAELKADTLMLVTPQHPAGH